MAFVTCAFWCILRHEAFLNRRQSGDPHSKMPPQSCPCVDLLWEIFLKPTLTPAFIAERQTFFAQMSCTMFAIFGYVFETAYNSLATQVKVFQHDKGYLAL